ncbi:hypothetical protein SAMN05444166_0234 [Singulisphaera sp. GP187]|uniref:hypothetical protein n=1 Tax=Singulisphaera sp. GP187 TaxID=1882752 RepID=UPI0009275E98|nr:hypothetical protein [Singulisphaera sp. GP187]SIN70098.1 hypothetical protein SAMN05444166_0234 [Singulisphaera sp. GP187]
MRSPSARSLPNRVALFRFSPTQNEDAGVDANSYGAAFATDVPCSVQPAEPERFLDNDTARLIQKTRWNVLFRDNYSLVADDKIVWADDVGVNHHLFVHGNADQAGRGAAFVVSCEERT